MADLRTNLAFNLRRLCGKSGVSISQTCRRIGINRSQFERYLEGKSLPHKQTATRISTFFGVSEGELYAPPPPARRNTDMTFSNAGEIISRFALPKPGLEEGYYYTFFTVPDDPDRIVCAVTILRAEESAMTFRRLTGLAEREGSYWSYAKGDHRGIVVERMNNFFFVGANEGSAREPSMLVVRWEPISEPILTGLAHVMTPTGPSSTTVIMRPCPPKSKLAQVLRSAHAYRVDDKFVSSVVAEIAVRERLLRRSRD